MTTDRLHVVALHCAEPMLTAPDIAKRLGISYRRVAMAARNAGISLPLTARGQKIATALAVRKIRKRIALRAEVERLAEKNRSLME